MSERERKLLIATTNRGKLAEFEEMLKPLRFRSVGLDSFDSVEEVAETAESFAANAELKASGYATQAGLLTLADDSGLEVTALGGRPGVHTARYGGIGTSFDHKMRSLLNELAEQGGVDRSARFVCAVSIAAANGKIVFTAEGVCSGRIAAEPRGKFGFGYDPIFIPDGFDRTFGELSAKIKAKISHRSRAFARIIPFLRDFKRILT
jgi:XTP/dITP diphosphohydrolase